MMNDSTVTRARAIRVFVSSTFRDMHAERDELVKRIFPRIRKFCEEREVTWGEVDLRWGVTEEQRAEGRMLPIVLEEVRRCRPYFIGILGNRYGTVPEAIPLELVEQEPWLASSKDRSVTELEILYGVLNDPSMACHAFFYFQNPKQGKGTEPETATNAAKLAALKNRIRAAPVPVRENYPDPKTFGELVEFDLRAVIEKEFPKTDLDPLDRELAEHEQYAKHRRRVYIGRPEYFATLDEHSSNDGAPLAVIGEAGIGKSALLANWAESYRQSHPGQPVILHFVGANGTSADWTAIVRRMLGEFQRLLGIELEVPVRPDLLRDAFANALRLVSGKRRVVILLDALNQLEDRDGAPDLIWLPATIPPNVRLVVSTLPGRPLDEIQKRGWPTLEVKPLELEERLRLIPEYLRQYSRTLEPERVERIASMPQCSNPLYLEALLNEMRLFGAYELLEAQIAHYLKAENASELYVRILERWEHDYEQDRPGLVAEAMTMLWAARQGLSETELREALGTDDEPLPHALWSALYLAADHGLLNRSGLVGPADDHLRRAIETKWLSSTDTRRSAHLAVASYFSKRQPGTIRALDEVPWQLMRASEWSQLVDFLADPNTLEKLWDRDSRMVRRYWHEIESSSSLRLTDSYAGLLDQTPTRATLHAQNAAANLLREFGSSDLVLAWCRRGRSSILPGEHLCWEVLTKLEAAILQDQGAFNEVVPLLGDLISLVESEDKALLTISLFERGSALNTLGQYDQGLKDLLRADKLAKEIGNSRLIGKVALERGHAMLHLGNLSTAEEQLKIAEIESRAVGDNLTLASAMDSLGSILMFKGDLVNAMRLFEDEVTICRDCSDQIGLARALTAKGNLMGKMDIRDSATVFRLFDEAEQLSQKTSNPIGRACAIGCRGRFLRRLGKNSEALACQVKEMAIWEGMKSVSFLAACLLEQSVTHYAMRNFAEAERCLNASNAIREPLGGPHLSDVEKLDETLLPEQLAGRKVKTLPVAFGSPAEAEEAERQIRQAISEEQLAHEECSPTIWMRRIELGNLLLLTGRPSEAAVQLDQALTIGREVFGKSPNISTNLNLLADAQIHLGQYEKAKSLLDEALEVDVLTGIKWSQERARTLSHLGQLMWKQGRLVEAEDYYRQALAMLELILPTDHEALSIPLSGLGCLLDDLGKKEESEQLHRRALANDLRAFGLDHPRLATRNHNLGCLLQSTGRLVEARECFLKTLEIDRKTRAAHSQEVAVDLVTIAEISAAIDDNADAARQIADATQALQGIETTEQDLCLKLFMLSGQILKGLTPVDARSLAKKALECAQTAFVNDVSETGQMLRRMVIAPEPPAGIEELGPGRRPAPSEGDISAMLVELNRSQIEHPSEEVGEKLLARALHLRKRSQGRQRQALTELMHRLAIDLQRSRRSGDRWSAVDADLVADDRGLQYDASSGWFEIAVRAFTRGDLELANQAADCTLELLRNLCDVDHANPIWLCGYASALTLKGDLELEHDQAVSAKLAFEQARAKYEELVRLVPDEALYLRGVAVSCDKLGDMARAANDLSSAQGAYLRALPAFRQAARIDPDFSRDLSLCLAKLGELELVRKDVVAAKRALEEHFALAMTISAADVNDMEHQMDLAGAHGRMALLAGAIGEIQETLEHAEAAHMIIEAVAGTDRSNVRWQQDLAGSLFNLGMLLAQDGDVGGGTKMVNRCYKMLNEMNRADQLDAKGRKLLRHVQGVFKRSE
jgi:nephrocystin-3